MCKTVHRLHMASGRSLSVNKQCTKEKECTHDNVGCHSTGIPGVMVSICNLMLSLGLKMYHYFMYEAFRVVMCDLYFTGLHSMLQQGILQ